MTKELKRNREEERERERERELSINEIARRLNSKLSINGTINFILDKELSIQFEKIDLYTYIYISDISNNGKKILNEFIIDKDITAQHLEIIAQEYLGKSSNNRANPELKKVKFFIFFRRK